MWEQWGKILSEYSLQKIRKLFPTARRVKFYFWLPEKHTWSSSSRCWPVLVSDGTDILPWNRSSDLLKCLPVFWRVTLKAEGGLTDNRLSGTSSSPRFPLGNLCQIRWGLCDFFAPWSCGTWLHTLECRVWEVQGGSWVQEFHTGCTKPGGSA